jgi:hypothetical protein
MDPLDPQSEDTALKMAVRRALGKESAPPQLRSRIEALLATEQRKAETKARVSWRRPILAMISAAAVLIIGLGVAYTLINQGNEAPQFFAAAMVKTHDESAASPDKLQIPGVPADASMATVRQELRKQLGHPVLVAELGDGWQFKGASVSQISGVPASELLFTKGDASVSVFSVSAGAFYMDNSRGDGTTYEQTEQNHPISGFVQGGAIHCLVGSSKSGKLSVKELTKLRDKLRGQVSMVDPLFYASAVGGCHP